MIMLINQTSKCMQIFCVICLICLIFKSRKNVFYLRIYEKMLVIRLDIILPSQRIETVGFISFNSWMFTSLSSKLFQGSFLISL